MKLDWLIYFREVARSEHLGRASKTLSISPSAVSRAITLLEEHVGSKLFEGQGKGIRLTEAGRKLQQHASRIIDEIGRLPSLMGGTSELSGSFRLTASHCLNETILAPAVASLTKQYPNFKCDIRTHRSADVVTGVLQGAYDIGICFSPQPQPDIDTYVIHSGQLRLVVRNRHPIIGKSNLGLLSNYHAVLPPAIQGIDLCDRHPMYDLYHIKVNPLCTIDHYGVAAELISSTNAWGFFPEFVLSMFAKKVTALPVPKKWVAPYQIALISNRKRPAETLIQELKEAIIENGTHPINPN